MRDTTLYGPSPLVLKALLSPGVFHNTKEPTSNVLSLTLLWVWPPTGREDGERSEGRRVEDWTEKIASNDSVCTHVLFLFLCVT